MPLERAEFTVLQPILWVRSQGHIQEDNVRDRKPKRTRTRMNMGGPKCIDQGLKVKGLQGPR